MPNSLAIMSKIPEDASAVLLRTGDKAPIVVMEKPPTIYEDVEDDFHLYPRTFPSQITDEEIDAACTCGQKKRIFPRARYGTSPACCDGMEELLQSYGSFPDKRVDTYHLPHTWLLWGGDAHTTKGCNDFQWLCPIDEDLYGPEYDVVAPGIPNIWSGHGYGYCCLGGNDKPMCHHEAWEAYWRAGKNDHLDPRRRDEVDGWWLRHAYKRDGVELPEYGPQPLPDPRMETAKRVTWDGIVDWRKPVEVALWNGVQNANRKWLDDRTLVPDLMLPLGLDENYYGDGGPAHWRKARRRSPRKRDEMARDEKVENALNRAWRYCRDHYYGPRGLLEQTRNKATYIERMVARRERVKNRQRPKPTGLTPRAWARRLRDLVWHLEMQFAKDRDISTTHFFTHMRSTIADLLPEYQRGIFTKLWRAETTHGLAPEDNKRRKMFAFGCEELGKDWFMKLALLAPPTQMTEDEVEENASKIIDVMMRRAAVQKEADGYPVPERPGRQRDKAFDWALKLRDNTAEWGKQHWRVGRPPRSLKKLHGITKDDLTRINREDMPPGFTILCQDVYPSGTYYGDDDADSMTYLIGGGMLRGLGEQGADLNKVTWRYGDNAVGLLPCAKIGEHFFVEIGDKIYCGRLMWRGAWGRDHGYDKVAQNTTYVICWGEMGPSSQENA